MGNLRNPSKSILGRSEMVELVKFNLKDVPAKIDTGAYRSSIHAINISLESGVLSFSILEGHPSCSQQMSREFKTSDFDKITVKNSFGEEQDRYIVNLEINMGEKNITSSFSLSNRINNNYPILIGRKTLSGNFIVDSEITGIDYEYFYSKYRTDFKQDEEVRVA